MAGKDTITISFAVKDGENGLKTLILDADGFRKVMEDNVNDSVKFEVVHPWLSR